MADDKNPEPKAKKPMYDHKSSQKAGDGDKKSETKPAAKKLEGEHTGELESKPKEAEKPKTPQERHAAERAELHKLHRGERRDLHGNHRNDQDQMHERHMAAHDAMAERQLAEMSQGAAPGAAPAGAPGAAPPAPVPGAPPMAA